MRALVAITARELRERWTLPFAMFCWGFVLLFLVRYVDITARPLALMTAVPAAWALALLMGGSVIARDLADGRLAFFFARPVPWWSIAGGKLLAALLLSVLAPAAAVLPAIVFDWNPAADLRGLRELVTGGSGLLLIALVLALVGFGHVASVVYRARSTWAAFDFLLLGACVWGGFWLYYGFARLGLVGGPPPSAWSLLLKLLLVAAVPLAALFAQVALGRSDLQRGHVVLSLTFWAGVLLWLGTLGGILARELAVTPTSLVARHLFGASPDERLIGLAGSVDRSEFASFLFDTATGHSQRLGEGSRSAFSADGRHAAWIEEPPFWHHDRTGDVQLARVEDQGVVVESVELDRSLPQEDGRGMALSPQADRLAIVQSSTLSVHELPSGRTLGRITAADGQWIAAAFLDGEELRAFRRVRPVVGPPGTPISPGYVEVVTLQGGVATHATRLDVGGLAFLASPAGEDLVLLSEPLTPRRASLVDARSGARLRTLSPDDGFQLEDAYLLADGRVAAIETLGPSVRLRLAAPGRADRLVALPEGTGFVGGELAGGVLDLGRFLPGVPTREARRETLFVSWNSGEIVGREAGLIPVRFRLGSSVRGAAAELAWSDAGELVRLDPSAHRREVLLPAAPVR
jgi:hypothetical protein